MPPNKQIAFRADEKLLADLTYIAANFGAPGLELSQSDAVRMALAAGIQALKIRLDDAGAARPPYSRDEALENHARLARGIPPRGLLESTYAAVESRLETPADPFAEPVRDWSKPPPPRRSAKLLAKSLDGKRVSRAPRRKK